LTVAQDDASSLVDHDTLRRLARALAERPGSLAPDDGAPRRAAVAIVLRNAGGQIELLLIKRSERADDPWSGHIALPGGRYSPADATLQDTAVRETREETGIDLARDGIVLGTLDELRPQSTMLPSIIVTPYVAVVRSDVSVETSSDEVASAFWVGVSALEDPLSAVQAEVSARGATWRVPSYQLAGHTVWGMTERMLSNLLVVLAA
jgi:8-oxo-dGTP pyrophosphatase MutT (NUDIX family)